MPTRTNGTSGPATDVPEITPPQTPIYIQDVVNKGDNKPLPEILNDKVSVPAFNEAMGSVNTEIGKLKDKDPCPYIGDNGNWWVNGIDMKVKPNGEAGKNGVDGTNGKDGITPRISNGKWFLGDVDTNVKAEGKDGTAGKNGKDGKDGSDGLTPYVGANGNWFVGSLDTGMKARGKAGATPYVKYGYWYIDGSTTGIRATGANGITPHIDPVSKHWMIGDVDTEIDAVGDDGAPGKELELKGEDGVLYWRVVGTVGGWKPLAIGGSLAGKDGVTPHIDKTTNHWMLGETDTNVSAVGPAGPTGAAGTNGVNGTNGITPSINETNKHWMIGETDTNVVAEGTPGPQGPIGKTGPQGEPGTPGTNGTNGTPGAKGEKGEPGLTPSIDATTKKWKIGETLTDVVAEGAQGPAGADGAPGAKGEPGQKGEPGAPGTNGTNGAKGDKGDPGPAPQLVIGTVTKLAADAQPTAELVADSSVPGKYTLNLGIPSATV